MIQKKDLLLIVVVALFAAIFSVVISKVVFSTSQHNLKAETVQPISTELKTPDPAVFNDQAIDPTQLIHIGDSSNKQPF